MLFGVYLMIFGTGISIRLALMTHKHCLNKKDLNPYQRVQWQDNKIRQSKRLSQHNNNHSILINFPQDQVEWMNRNHLDNKRKQGIHHNYCKQERLIINLIINPCYQMLQTQLLSKIPMVHYIEILTLCNHPLWEIKNIAMIFLFRGNP